MLAKNLAPEIALLSTPRGLQASLRTRSAKTPLRPDYPGTEQGRCWDVAGTGGVRLVAGEVVAHPLSQSLLSRTTWLVAGWPGTQQVSVNGCGREEETGGRRDG